jgi:outer membrane protein TolC
MQVGCTSIPEPDAKLRTADYTSDWSREDTPQLIQQTAFHESQFSSENDHLPHKLVLENSGESYAGLRELSTEALVQEVLARNPSLSQMMAAAQAAAARYPQVISLEDPMFGARAGPGSIGANNVNFAYTLEASQKLPFPGKRALRGENALAEASASGHEVEDMRLQLIESAKIAFYDYYLVERALEVNAESIGLLQDAKRDAEARYRAGKVEQQDVLQASVEVGRERERRLSLEATLRIVAARINTLMHLPADKPVPPPPKELKPDLSLPDVQSLRELALSRRPDLQALADRIKAEAATLGLALKDYYPDFEVSAGYDAFWQEPQLRSALGLRLNVPIFKARRLGAVTEAEAKIAQRQAELARQTDQVSYEVQEAFEKTRTSEKAVRLYEESILPEARLNVKAARSSYIAGKISVLSRIEAERSLVNLQDKYFESIADYFRRRATLERVIAAPLNP